MEYKAGDKVKIRTWKEMVKEYGLSPLGFIKHSDPWLFSIRMEEQLNKRFSNRILTIKRRDSKMKNYYHMKELRYVWNEG